MLRPTKEDVVMDDRSLYVMSRRERAKFRAENIGFIFQTFQLIPYLNVIENILLPAMMKPQAERGYAMALLSRFRLSGRELHKPSELSVGEKQRTAIARALFNRPKIILADEPTGNLDPENAAEAVEYIEEFHRNGGTVIFATHGTAADEYADRIVHLQEGHITSEEVCKKWVG
jgi:ABC-type lipoprotein export system ATPase subunit